jgi:hypothetical protein
VVTAWPAVAGTYLDAQPARQYLRAHREHQDQAHPEHDLVGAHRLPFSRQPWLA